MIHCMNRRICALILVVLALGTASAVSAAAPAGDAMASASASESAAAAAEIARENKILDSLHPIRGTIPVPEADAQLQLGKSYYFLGKDEARKVVVDLWGNPPAQADDVLGLIVPEGSNPLNDWSAVVTYQKTDYVSDKDADSTDYAGYIKQIQDGEADENATRQKDGYATTHLVGWAQPPSYDKASHTMIWARDIKFSDSQTDTLNYDIRLLGRRGVLSLNMVSNMPDLAYVHKAAAQLAAAGHYNTGARYEDYQAGDKKAAFGVGGLVAAGIGLVVAKKVGLLGVLLLFAKKGFIIIAGAFAAIGRWFSGIFGKKKAPLPKPGAPSAPLDETPPASTGGVNLTKPTVEEASRQRKTIE